MQIYVAAKYTDKPKVKEIQQHLKEAGHEITHDWTLHQDIRPFKDNADLAEYYAIRDLDGVRNADVFIFLINQALSTGCATELGAALMLNLTFGKPDIFLIGNDLQNNLFYYHPNVMKCADIEDLLAKLVS